MKHLSASLVVSALALAIATPRLRADEPIPTHRARETGVFTFYFENDYFGAQDRNYTNGIKLSWLSADLDAWGLAGWRHRFVDMLPFVNGPHTQKNLGFAFGQNIYTPRDISREPPDPKDRPYAGWSYLELAFISKSDSVRDTFSIQVGMVGRHSYAQDTQRVVHKWLDDEHPEGWDHQIGDELGINLVYEHNWRLYARTLGHDFGVDLTPGVGASLGNVQTFANAGLTMRLGYNLPSDFGVSLIKATSGTDAPVDDSDPRVSRRGGWSFFLFGGANGKAVARDIFLDGNTFRDSPSVEKRPFVGELSYGIGILKGRWQLTYTQVVRSIEFEGQDGKSYFGSVAISRIF
jgi:hypothetical protein